MDEVAKKKLVWYWDGDTGPSTHKSNDWLTNWLRKLTLAFLKKKDVSWVCICLMVKFFFSTGVCWCRYLWEYFIIFQECLASISTRLGHGLWNRMDAKLPVTWSTFESSKNLWIFVVKKKCCITGGFGMFWKIWANSKLLALGVASFVSWLLNSPDDLHPKNSGREMKIWKLNASCWEHDRDQLRSFLCFLFNWRTNWRLKAVRHGFFFESLGMVSGSPC